MQGSASIQTLPYCQHCLGQNSNNSSSIPTKPVIHSGTAGTLPSFMELHEIHDSGTIRRLCCKVNKCNINSNDTVVTSGTFSSQISRRQPQTICESEIIACYHGNSEEKQNIEKWRDHVQEYRYDVSIVHLNLLKRITFMSSFILSRSKQLELEERAKQIYRSFS